MTLGEKQELFAKLLARLVLRIELEPGYEVRLGELHRPQRMADYYARIGIGIRDSNHTRCIAIDIALMQDGLYLTESASYTWLGEWWEQQHALCRWGGRFAKPDGGHFSLEHEGVA